MAKIFSIHLPKFAKIRYQEWKYFEQSRKLKVLKIICKIMFIGDKAQEIISYIRAMEFKFCLPWN